MPVRILRQSNLSAGYGRLVPEQPKPSRFGQPTAMPDIFVPAFWSVIGLLVSVPFLPLLSNAIVDQDTFSLLVGLF
jgi:hypothetical protein